MITPKIFTHLLKSFYRIFYPHKRKNIYPCSRDQRRGERPRDERTIFTKRKEERVRAAEMMTDDDNSEVEIDSDYEALCAVLDQQKKKKMTKTEKNS